MTNMMNGAVAIYGGYGAMEIRQPLTQAVESVAQAVEDLAVNAHISLRELKNTVAAVIEKKLPKYAQLMEMHPVIAARTVVGGATLTAYENGYAVYEEDGAHTVMAIDRCGDYRYDFNDGTYEVVPAAVFEDAEWSVRLVMEGERRMESNRSKTVAINEAASLDCDGSDWSDAVMVDFLDEENAEMLAEEELRKLYAAMGKLTERQQEIIQLYFYKGLTQYEIAEELGIARPVVSKTMTAAIKKLKKSMATANKTMSATKVVIPCRISFANIFEPKSINGGDAKYSVSCLIPKADKKTLLAIHKAVEAAKEDGKTRKWGGKIPPNLKMPLRDGDIDRPDDENYQEHFFLNATSKDAPQVVDRHVQPVTDPMMVYSGCYCNVSVNFYAFNANGNRGVAAGLGNIQFVKDGDRLSGRASADADFDALEDDEEVLGDDSGEELPDYLR